MKINQVLKEELERIAVPIDEEKELLSLAKGYVKKLSRWDVKVVLGGSLAKGTLIKKDIQDIDIFAIFDKEEDTKNLEKILKKEGLKGKKLHGSRDYFQINKKGVMFEIIPVVKLPKKLEEANNVTDFSLTHVGYVKKKLLKNRKLASEIKLAKTFCFAQGCYGAESYIRGFSGYALEVLVISFGGFVKFLKGIQKNKVIDSEKQFKNESKIMTELNESKLQSPVILIDPTYKYRNVSAGLSKETFEKFLNVSKKFLRAPSANFFKKKKLDIGALEKKAEKRKAKFLEFDFRTDRQEGDIAATKMKKFFEFLVKQFERKEQNVLDKAFIYNGKKEAKGYLIVKEKKEIEIQGPSICMKEQIKNFKRVRKNTFSKKGCLYAKEKVDLKDVFAHVKLFEGEMGVQIN